MSEPLLQMRLPAMGNLSGEAKAALYAKLELSQLKRSFSHSASVGKR
jgi:hypothetical protein